MLTEAQLDDAMQQIENLLGPAQGRVRVGVRGGNRVRLGDRMIFEVRSDIAGRLVILDINASREVTLLYPNQFVAADDLGRVAAGASIAVPGSDYQGFTAFEAAEPLGKGLLPAMVVPEDFEIERFAADRAAMSQRIAPRTAPTSYLMRIIRQIEAALTISSNDSSSSTAKLLQWGFARF